MYHILSQSVRFCRLYIGLKEDFGVCVFRFTVYIVAKRKHRLIRTIYGKLVNWKFYLCIGKHGFHEEIFNISGHVSAHGNQSWAVDRLHV